MKKLWFGLSGFLVLFSLLFYFRDRRVLPFRSEPNGPDANRLQQQDHQAKIDHPELTICSANQRTDKDGNKILLIGQACNPGFEPWIYDDDREVIAEVRILTADGIATDIVPALTHGRGSKAEHLDGYRFNIQGSVNYKMTTKLSGGHIVRLQIIE